MQISTDFEGELPCSALIYPFVDFLQIIDHCFLFVTYIDRSLKGKPRAGFLHTQLLKPQHTYIQLILFLTYQIYKKDLFPKSLNNKFGSRSFGFTSLVL
ncbi:putative d-arabinitol 2-dehydrogenase protein [Botrytis fragariae]|uniref:Putative d-arabinitol 2-dehydrogenase protein n=1 Tax=Botrytis fragariae TaxID=1964551 RepID=A0A8H6EFM8_9HELO|nr:putative d-arabinitol 2-dehydrogenase protein [Botrytis fragariae]KAF5870421.1 putative d-arabinitol 2-dehydrogenase protein [Botrytis fragariae]